MKNSNDKQRDAFVAEIMRLENAVKKTNSKYLKKDYGKRIAKMRMELKQYDKYKNSR